MEPNRRVDGPAHEPALARQSTRLALLVLAAWAVLTVAFFHDRLLGEWDATTRDVAVLLAVPPLIVLAVMALLRAMNRPG